MIVASEIELRAGARLLLEGASFQVGAGDRIGLVGGNGAGETPRGAGRRRREGGLAAPIPGAAADAIRRYGRLEERLAVLGGYAAESQAASITASLGLPDRVLHQALHTLSGGQRRRVELARILFSGSETMLLDEPTNHLDADSVVWLRDHLKSYRGGLVVISHDVALLADVVNKVFYLDAQRACLDMYNLGWRSYLQQRETDERRRRRERVNAGRQASTLMAQADKMRAKATKARAAQNMQRRAERMLAGVEAERTADKVAKLRFPVPAPCGRTPLTAVGLSKSYGSAEVFTGVDVAVDRGSRVVVLGLNGAGKTTLLRLLAGLETPDTGKVTPGHGLSLGYYAQEHETLETEQTVLAHMRIAALRSFRGAIVLVTHDEGAVEALSPERVIVLPDGVEDAWSEDFADLVALA